MDVQKVLSHQIQKLIQDNPAFGLKPIDILPTVNHHVDDQLKQRLLQTKNDNHGERIVLIPYDLEKCHQTGIFIKFKADNQIERAEFINPVNESNYIPDQLQQYFSEIFPDAHLRLATCETIGDRTLSPVLTIKSLLALVNESKFATSESLSTDNTRTERIDWQQKDQNIDKPLFSEGNHLKFSDSVENSNHEHTLQLPVKILETESLKEITHSSITTVDVHNLTTDIPIKKKETPSITESYKELKKDLQDRFDELDINNGNELESRIDEKKKRIEELMKQGKSDNARKREQSLTRLLEVQLLMNKLKEFETSEPNNDLEILKNQLHTAFAERDIDNEDHLKELIMKKKERIEILKKEKKHESVRLRENSLSELEDLQLLVDKISTLKSSITQIESENTQEVVHDIHVNDNLIDNSDPDEFSATNENLRYMYEDFFSMPPCSERFVISLLYYISLQLIDKNITLDPSIVQPDQIEIKIDSELENLKDRLLLEELSSSEIQNSIKDLSIYIKNQHWEKCISLLRKIFKEISPLNIHDLFRLIKKVDNAAELIKGKDIIFFLGGTGSGKSTTVHFLAGSKMIPTILKGLNHIAVIDIKNPDLKSVTTSPFPRSETRYITPVTVNFKDIGVSRNGSIILCDTPGFEDTNGPEVDIANGISIVNAIRQCKSVKPVIVISYKSIGDRFEGMKKLTHLLAGLIPGIQDQITAFSYIFTKYPENERNQIHASLEHINMTMNDQETSDTSFMNLFVDMLQKTERHTLVLDPIHDKPRDLLYELVNSAVIRYPEEVFQFSITEKSKTIVHEQIRLYQISIISAIKRFEYTLVKYQLDQLKRLNNLLNQDYIEQIYTNCIRHLSKCLSEEYQEGTLMLNRCLLHQTILNDDDIKQYRTYIDHANFAETLKTDHLDNEFIHSSAFIQYLNQQVDILSAELKDKEIDDSSVKLILDKIKLLRKYFPNISNTYESICQLFIEKIEFKVNSFENFVLNNQFNECTAIMTNLLSALNTLYDHLDRQNIEMKYFELKEYFLNYLKSSVKDLDYIFQKPSLDESDIDKTNNCIIMLEAVLKTFNLEVHISKEDINEIYKSFLSKIFKYFENIIQEIKIEFQKQNAFQNLENLIQQLGLIRTISSIALETSSMYHSTLEELFGYIYQSRRDAEEFLRLLFQGDEIVDYEKLVKCLLNLKSATWIEKYRSGVYSDVINNVEQLIIQHIEKLKQSICQINLDLDHSHEIKNVSKMLSHINNMKHLESFIPIIKQHIEEVNSWFNNTIKNVFDIIKNIFSSEKWKEQEYKTLDSIKAEKAFYYLDSCKGMPILTKMDCISVLNTLESFIRDFSDFVEKEMEICFETIKKSQNINTNEILDNACVLSKRLQEISDLEKSCPRVFSHFSKITIVKDWQNDLSNYCFELSGEMAKLSFTQRTEALNTKLSIAKALSKLDKFLEGEKYIDIYNKYQNIFFIKNSDIGQQVIDAIKNFDYESVAARMMTLQSSNEVGSHFYTEAKRPLNAGLNQLMEGTEHQVIMLGNNIAIEDIKLIVENLKRMERAKQFVEKHLDAPQKIDDCIRNVKEIMQERIKRYLVRVRALIDNHNFYEADKKIESITLVLNLLGKYCTKDISDEIENLNEYQNTVVLANVVDKYSQMDISSYTLNPPTDIFERFGQVNQTNPVYNQALNQIKEKIVAKFREELDKAKSKQPPDSENIHIRRFESAVKYLPEAMRSALEVELRHCKEDIVQLIRDNENKLNHAFNSGDVRNIKTILLEYEKSQELQSFANRVKALVLKQIQDIVQKINENFERDEIREAFTHVKKLYNYKIELEEVIIDINRPYSEVRLRIIKIFEDAYLFFTNRFLNSHISMNENESVPAIEKSFICLTEFMKFKDDHINQQILIYILPDDFNNKIILLIKKIQDYSSEHETKYKNALEKIDIDSLFNILKIMYTWSSLLTKIKVYYDMYNNRDTSMEIMMTSLQQLTHHSQMLQLISRKIEDLRNELLNQELINQDTKEFSQVRDEFYRKLNEKYCILKRAKIFSQFNIQIDIDKIERDCIESLESKIRTIITNSERLSHKVSQDNILTKIEYENFNLYYNNLLSIRQEIKFIHIDIQLNITQIEEVIFDKIHTWEASIENDSRLQNVVTNLKNIKRIANNISSFRIKVNERLDDILKNYKNKQDAKAFAKLGTVLNQDKDGIGQSIILEHKLFQGFSLSLFNEKTRRHGIEYVLDNLKGDHLDKIKLRRRYDEFHSTYEKIVKENLSPDMKFDKLIADTELIAGKMKQNSETITWNANVRDQVPKLAAHIFALWTLSKAEHYFEAEGLDDRENYLLQPHAAQIISIFRLLGIGDNREDLTNNLVQIGTGEGKSITLGVTATILALIGFEVNCACFSEYLSHRDYLAFSPLFYSLDVLHYIHYGTFNKLCEDMINENGDIRHLVGKLISNDKNDDKKINQKNKRPKILLIDEVDVFFSREFYGNVYTPSASLKDSTIKSLVNLIWTRRKSNLNLRTIRTTPEYKACSEKYPYWILLIDEIIKDMLADVHSFESHDYVVKNDKIGYIEQDNIVYNVVYGYKTLFAYHHEYEKNNISKESLDENICIRINCGSFSYAEIPLQFKYIMGVTGTLETLSDPERKVIQKNYKIIKNTYVPSVFGQNNLRFIEKDDIIIENSNDYFNRIKREIDDRIIGKNSEKRAILVVFESKARLMQFYESPALQPIKESVLYLTEDTLSQEKDIIINRATVSGQITLLTRAFGRGTDFICHDQIVASNGGTHVIQTFLSEEFSEEKQIKGRTARQGDQGSYCMILLDQDLEKFHIEKSHIDDILKGKGLIATFTDAMKLTKHYETLYPFLHDKRTELFKTQYEANIKYVEQAKEKHLISQEFLSSLRSEDIESIRKFLIEENRGAGSTSQSRTVCLMDATGSMVHLLHKCKNTVNIMFERASEILKDHRMNPDSFQIQFSVYRNYNSGEDKLLQSSPWETRPNNLRSFMNTIDAEGGWNNEAIEIGLWHANKENERERITQVILIGDAPPNTKEEVQFKRNSCGQKYWKKTKFVETTDYEKELKKLIENDIPVHAFYVEMRARESFQQIANQTGGRCEMLDINSSLGSDMLTDLITEEILNNVGGEQKGKDLVKAYRKKFPKSYTSAADSMITTQDHSSDTTFQTPLASSPTARVINALFQMNKKQNSS